MANTGITFQGKAKLTSAEFVEVFKKFDVDGNGFIEAEELDDFLQALWKELKVKDTGTEDPSKEQLEQYKQEILGKFDENFDGKLAMGELENILPTEENFLATLRKNADDIDSVDFMKIWYNYDKDKSGYLENAELEGFLRDLLKQSNQVLSPTRIKDYADTFICMYDKNKDGKIELAELSLMLPVEKNFFTKFERHEKLTRGEFEEIFDHYDKDKSGQIEDCELLALLRDILEREHIEPTSTELEEYKAEVMKVSDTDGNGKLSKDELCLLLSAPKA